MKVLICGKGGSGKSAITTLLAKEMGRRGFKTVVVDNDESNYGLHAQLGVEIPNYLINHFGGRKKAAETLFDDEKSVFDRRWKMRDIPKEHLSEKGNVSLLVIGKIHDFAEGCACPMNALTKDFLKNLELDRDELVLVDADAGVEHFGRGVEESCDLIMVVIDPTEESVRLAGRISGMAEQIDKDVSYVLNRADGEVQRLLIQKVEREKVITSVPEDRRIFRYCLEGKELDFRVESIGDIADMLEIRSKAAGG